VGRSSTALRIGAKTTSRAVSECEESLVTGIVEWEKAHESVAGGGDWIRVRCLRSASERDDRQMSPSAMVADREMEPDSGLTADESLR